MLTEEPRQAAINAVTKVRNDSDDCACDGCIVDAVIANAGSATRALRAEALLSEVAQYISAPAWLRQKIEDVLTEASNDRR